MVQLPYETDRDWVQALIAGSFAAWGDVPSEPGEVRRSGLLGLFFEWAWRDMRDADRAKDIALEAGNRVLQ